MGHEHHYRTEVIVAILELNTSFNRGDLGMKSLREHFIQNDVEEILKIRLSARNSEDVVAWGLEKSGMFQSVVRII